MTELLSQKEFPVKAVPTGHWRLGRIPEPNMFCIEGKPDHVKGNLESHGFTVSVKSSRQPHIFWAEKGGKYAMVYAYAFGSLGAALLQSTGQPGFIVFLSGVAKKKYMRLRRDGLYKGVNKIHGKTEEGIFQALGIPYIDPKLRDVKGKWDYWELWKVPELKRLRLSLLSGG